MKPILYLFLFLCFFARAQQARQAINQSLDNTLLVSANEDTLNFSTKNIYSVKLYKLATKNKTNEDLKNINGKPFELLNYTEYLPDGRKRYKKYTYDELDRIEKYYYDTNFNNLSLGLVIEDNKVFNYRWLSYDKNSTLIACINYRTYPGKDFDFESYQKYTASYSEKETKIVFLEINSDTLAQSTKTNIYAYPYLTKIRPEYPSKEEKYKLINGRYRPKKVAEQRN